MTMITALSDLQDAELIPVFNRLPSKTVPIPIMSKMIDNRRDVGKL